MRSLFGLTALAVALTGSLDLASAKKTCKARSSAGGLGGSLTTAQTATTTPSAGGLAPRGVPNLVVNGNFVGYDPNVAGGIYGFEADGDARQVTGIGYTGDNSQETACAYFTVPDSPNTNTGASKRDAVESPQVASIRQWLQETDRESVYTMRVWYYVDYNKLADTCKLVATYDNNVFVESPYFPVVAKDSGSFSWSPLIQQSPVLSDSGYLKFEVQCIGGGAADVRFDQVFFTNEVSLRDLDDITVIYSSFADTPTVPPTVSSTATAPASVTAVASTGSSTVAISSTGVSSTVSPGTIVSSATGSGTQIASSTTSAAPSASSSLGDNTCIVLGSASVAGRGCAKRPYVGSSGYKTFPNPDITKDQCAALCFSDSRCQSFQWSSQGSGCMNYCSLLETSLSAGSADNGGNGSPWAYDRSCIAQSVCPQAPADTVCVNGQGNTPGAGCTQFQGVAKSCATPFMTASMSLVCGVGNGCRDLCAQTPSCKSYSYSYDSANNCKLYSASAATIGTAQGSGSILFADISCSACGTGMAQFKYLSKLSDPDNMPVQSCPDPSATLASTLVPTTTTQSSPSTASSCPQYVTAPGMCYTATPTAVGSVCNKRGTNSNSYTKSLDEAPNQTMSEYCALACDSDPECKSYTWDPNLSPFNCQFSKNTVTDDIAADVFMPSEMVNQRWYDMGCMRCVHCGTTSQSSTLLSSLSLASSTVPSATTTTAASSTSQSTCPGGLACTAKTYAPAGVYCKQQGQFSDLIGASTPDPVKFPNKAASAEECASICTQTTNCLASSFSVAQGCGLITKTLAQASFVPGTSADSSGTIWSDNACFNCAACGTTASSTVATQTSTVSSSTPAATSTGSSTASPTDCFGLSCKVTSPVASGLYCRKPGNFPDDIGVWVPDTTKFPLKPITVEQCAAICMQDSRCKSSSFTSRGLCQLFDRTLSAAGFIPSAVKTDDVWSDNACFECTSCSSTSTPATLPSSTVPPTTTTTPTPLSSTVPPTTTTTPTPSSTTDGCPTWLAGPGGCVHSTPFPSGYICDVKGSVPASSVYTYSLATQPLQRGFGDCAWICFNDPNCKAYGWVSGTSSGCKFSTTSLDGQLATDSTSDTRWFNMNCPQCYSCPDKAPLSTKTPVSVLPSTASTASTPTTFGTVTTPASSSTDLISTSNTEPLITPYPPMTTTTAAATTTSSAPVAAQTCSAPAAVLPDDATCGIPGNGGQQLQSYRLDNYVIKPVGSLAACAKDCLARADCLGFSYTKDDTSCRPYRRGTSDLGITYVPANSIRYYDRACFTCPS
ncbi:unnamed protein product [Clonostachys rosea]|uniref:Apple domain-containing protein n=1 Tax=Bionectria ochroleuca TaxID=29856 RepID=A0ABY6TZH5_BIOOC|nr:unnamed protein product [Clonostachys rosea]